MPALGNRPGQRVVLPQVRRPNPAPPPPPSRAPVEVNLRAPVSGEPFRPAQRQAQRKVVQAQRALPKEPTPNLPRLPNPTPAQAHAALAIAQEHQRASGKPAATYWREASNDPRQRQYLATVEHYARAAQGHAAAVLGRTQAGGGENAAAQFSPAAQKLTRAEAVAVGRQLLANAAHPTAKPAPAPKDVALPLFGAAEIRVPGTANLASGLSHALAAITPGLQGNTPEESFFRNAGKDALAIGELPLIGGYQVANAGIHAATGDFTPAKQLASGVAQGIEQGAAGQLVQGNLSGAEKALREHPLFTALEALGASGIAGRSAGALARGLGSQAEDAGARGALARLGSQVRQPIALTDDAGAAAQGLVRQRTHSPDLIRKAVQVAADKRRQPVLDKNGQPVTISDRGRQVQVLKPTAREEQSFAKRRGNFEAARTQAGEHIERENVRKAVNAAESPGRTPLPAVRGHLARELPHLVATGTIRGVDTFREDLAKRAAAVAEATNHPENFRTRADLKAAQANAKLLARAAKSDRVAKQAPAIVEQGLRLAHELNAGDVRDAQLGIHPHEELARAALSEYALAHMPVQHFSVADHQAAEAQARAAEQQAQAMVAHTVAGTPEHDAALAEHAAARAERMAVSGRGLPEHIAAHEATQQAVVRARGALSTAQDELKRAERARVRQVGVHASRRGSQGLRPASARERAQSAAAIERVKTQKANVRAATAELRAARETAKASKLPPIKEGLRKANGHILTNQEIREHAAASGRNPDTLAYSPHVIGAGNKRAFHQRYDPGTRPAGNGPSRTGALFNVGATSFGRENIREALTGKATTAHKAEALDHFAQEAGLKRPDGRYFTAKEGVELANRFEHEGGPQYVPVRAFGAKLPKETREALADAQSSAEMETAHLNLLNSRIVTDGLDTTGARNVVLVPRHLVDALKAQIQPSSSLERSVQLLNGPFRMAVLPQPRWLTGNFIEPFFVRLPLSGSGINLPGAALDIAAGRKALRAMERSGDPAQVRAAKEIRGQQFGGLFIGRRGASVRRTWQDFSGVEGRALYGAHVARNLPAVKQLGDLALSLPHAFFHINRVIESTAQQMAFGKSVRRDIQQFTGKWSQTVLLGQKAIADVGKGLVDTPAQHRFMEAQQELLGQYDSFNPRLRKLVQTVAPFLPWTLASMRFVFWTLPAHHTVAFNGLLKAGQSVQADWEREHADVPPGTLKDALLRPDGGLVDLGRYTPYGITSPLVQGDLSQLSNPLLPQLSGTIKAAEGQDPFGRALQVPKGTGNPKGEATGGQRAGIAAYSTLESLVPLLATARRLREGGGTPYANSTLWSPKVKPGTSHISALNRTLNPFRPTYLKKPKATGGRATTRSPREARAIERSERVSPATEERIRRALARSEGR